MGRFIARRLASMVLVMFAVSVLTFLIFNVIPNNDPAVRMAGRQASDSTVEAIRIVGSRWSAKTHALRDQLERNSVAVGFY